MEEISEIRIFPMGSVDGDTKTIRHVKKYLTDKLPNEQEGKYYYRSEPGMKYIENTKVLVLFQYDGMIRGCGTLIGLNTEDGKEEFGHYYPGYFLFEPESIKFFNNPIRKAKLSKISEKFENFTQGKQTIELENLDKIMEEINKRIK